MEHYVLPYQYAKKKKKKKAMYFYGLTKRWSHGEMEPWSYAPKGGTDNQALT